MDVHLLRPDSSRYEVLVLECEDDAGRMLEASAGRPVHGAWMPVPVRVFREDDDHKSRPRSDFPSLSGFVPVFSCRAASALAEFLMPNGEVLPLTCSEGEYLAYNVTSIVDALDEAHSECWYIGRKLVDVRSYELFPDRLEGRSVFKLAQFQRGGKMYVTGQFVRRVHDEGLVGFDMKRVWPRDRQEA